LASKKKLPDHVYKISENLFRVRYRKSNKYPFDYDEYFNTPEEAIEANEKYLAKNTLNLLSDEPKKIGFSDFCDLYIEWFKTKPKRPSHNTIKGYISKIKRLKEMFGNQTMSTISQWEIEGALIKEKNRIKASNGNVKQETISAHTLNHEYRMLCILFAKAKEWGFIKTNPTKGIEEPEYDIKKIEVPEFEELSILEEKINKCEIRERCQFLLALFTGFREEEICGLHIEDIDIKERTVTTQHAIVQNQDTREWIEDRLKSKSSYRTVPLPNRFFDVLNDYYKYRKVQIDYLKLKTHGHYKEIPNIFLNKDGHYYRPNRLSRTWSIFRNKYNIDLKFHGLRHFYITNQMNYNPNLSASDVQALAGHANIKTTYGYVHPSKKKINNKAVEIFDDFDKYSLYKNNKDVLHIPINHIATIILGNPNLSKIDDLKITLTELTSIDVDFYNISTVLIKSKKYLLKKYPNLKKMEDYNYLVKEQNNLLKELVNEFGTNFCVNKISINELNNEL